MGGSAERPGDVANVELGAIHPNPTDGATRLEFEMERAGTVSLGIFNLLGQEIQPILDGEFRAAGRYEAAWSTASLANGAYVCRLRVDGSVDSRLFVVSR